MSTQLTRRRALLAAGSAATVGIAGCTADSTQRNEPQELRREDWADVDEIRLEGYMRGFYGVEPDRIADIQNPAILLIEGQEYDLTWENGDGGRHNIAIWDEDRSVVDDLTTQVIGDRGETQTLSFTATHEMHSYVCEPHPNSMIGHFKVVE